MDCSDAYTVTKEILYAKCFNCGHENKFDDDTCLYADVFGSLLKTTFNCENCGRLNSIEYSRVRII